MFIYNVYIYYFIPFTPTLNIVQETAAAIQAACTSAGTPDLAPNLASYYAVLLHALEPSQDPARFRPECRELLLDGVPVYTPARKWDRSKGQIVRMSRI
jgi:hypothetical protein